MGDRDLLGPADVPDETLTAMVADLLGHDPTEVTLVRSRADRVDYDLPAITTAGRYWVSGTVRAAGRDAAYRMFVKHVQAWHHHPMFAGVPPEHREVAAASVPWRTEPLAYRSDLRDRLPDGLAMPRALGVFDLPGDAAAVWLEEVTTAGPAWDLPRYERAARLLGRLAASSRVAELGNVDGAEWTLADYVDGRLAVQVVPILMSDDVWRHPLLAPAFDEELRDRLRAAADRLPEFAAELLAAPTMNAHGDASPNNLLPGPTPDSFTLIDYGFWRPNPVGFDLGQLLVGDVQIGRRSPDLLAETDEAIVAAYVSGLAAEGRALPPEVVRRAHALQLLVFTGLSALPFELLGEAPTPELAEVVRSRAALARFSLDLVAASD